MSDLAALVGVELAKLRRSLALLACILAPAIVATLQILVLLKKGAVHDAAGLATAAGMSALSVWAIFMLPLLTALVLTLLFVQERPHGGWQVLYSLPVARWTIVAAKQIVAVALAGASTALALLFTLGGYQLVRTSAPALGWPPIDGATALAFAAARLWAAALLLLALQAWVALRSTGVVGSIGFGVAGVFFAVFAAGWEHGQLYPWLMPLHALQLTPGKGVTALVAGASGGLALLLGALASSVRRPPTS